MTAHGYDLRAAIRAVVADSDLVGPRDIATKVAENVPDEHLRPALSEALVAYVQHLLQDMRRPKALKAVARPSKASASPKVAAIRESWRRTLAGQFHIGGGQWRVLSDCTHDQVMFLAQERVQQARRVSATAEMFNQLAEAMRRTRAARVSDVPEAALARILAMEIAA